MAVIEDDVPTSNQLKGWIEIARARACRSTSGSTATMPTAAIERESYDLVVLDIELGRERHAGVALINAINKRGGTPVLVVSGMPASIYRSIMKALDAWDYLQKSDFDEHEFIETFLEMLRAAKDGRRRPPASAGRRRRTVARPAAPELADLARPAHQPAADRAAHPRRAATSSRGQVVSYDELFQVVKSGRNRDNVRKHVSTIRDAFREIDPAFDAIENVPMRGFRWTGA